MYRYYIEMLLGKFGPYTTQWLAKSALNDHVGDIQPLSISLIVKLDEEGIATGALVYYLTCTYTCGEGRVSKPYLFHFYEGPPRSDISDYMSVHGLEISFSPLYVLHEHFARTTCQWQ